MIYHQQLDDLYHYLEKNSSDPLAYSSLADWYEENGFLREADCFRWMVKNNKNPFRYRAKNRDLRHHHESWRNRWFWWVSTRERPQWGYPDSCRIPHKIWKKLGHSFSYDPLVFKEYPSVRVAIDALLKIWVPVGNKKSSTKKSSGSRVRSHSL